MDVGAIVDEVREVLEGTRGSVRVVPQGALAEGPPEPLGAAALERLSALTRPVYDVQEGLPRRTSAVGPSTASRAVYALPLVLTLTFALTEVADAASSDHRHAVRSAAADLAVAVSQALSWPGNVSAGVVPGSLREVSRATRERWAVGLYHVELEYEALVLETQEVA